MSYNIHELVRSNDISTLSDMLKNEYSNEDIKKLVYASMVFKRLNIFDKFVSLLDIVDTSGVLYLYIGIHADLYFCKRLIEHGVDKTLYNYIEKAVHMNNIGLTELFIANNFDTYSFNTESNIRVILANYPDFFYMMLKYSDKKSYIYEMICDKSDKNYLKQYMKQIKFKEMLLEI